MWLGHMLQVHTKHGIMFIPWSSIPSQIIPLINSKENIPTQWKCNENHPFVGEMVQNSQSLYSFTFNAVTVIHEYIYSHSTTKFIFKKYIYSHLPVNFLFTIIFAHIYKMSSFTFNMLYSFTFTIEIFIQHFLRTTFTHH